MMKVFHFHICIKWCAKPVQHIENYYLILYMAFTMHEIASITIYCANWTALPFMVETSESRYANDLCVKIRAN